MRLFQVVLITVLVGLASLNAAMHHQTAFSGANALFLFDALKAEYDKNKSLGVPDDKQLISMEKTSINQVQAKLTLAPVGILCAITYDMEGKYDVEACKCVVTIGDSGSSLTKEDVLKRLDLQQLLRTLEKHEGPLIGSPFFNG